MESNDTLYLVSNGSMSIFPENTLSAFTNLLAEPLSLQGEWRVALSEINTPSTMKNVSKTEFIRLEALYFGEAIGWSTEGIYTIEAGVYHNVSELLEQIQEVSGISMSWEINPIDQKLSITFDLGDGLCFPTREIVNILGFQGIPYLFLGSEGVQIGHQQYRKLVGKEKSNENAKFTLTGDYPIDLTGGRHLIFVYLDIIEYQSVADTKAPLLRLISCDTRLKNGTINAIETLKTRTFKTLEFKSLLSNNIKSIRAELRTESGDLVPFIGTGRTTLSLKFFKVS